MDGCHPGLAKIFEVDSVVSNTLQQKINRYNQLFANQGEKSEIQQLEQELKAHLINGSISDQRYLRFLELMKKKGFGILNQQEVEKWDFNEDEWSEIEGEISDSDS